MRTLSRAGIIYSNDLRQARQTACVKHTRPLKGVETVYVNVASVLMVRCACAGSHLLFLASFASNDTTMSQFHALTMLGESFPRSMTVCY